MLIHFTWWLNNRSVTRRIKFSIDGSSIKRRPQNVLFGCPKNIHVVRPRNVQIKHPRNVRIVRNANVRTSFEHPMGTFRGRLMRTSYVRLILYVECPWKFNVTETLYERTFWTYRKRPRNVQMLAGWKLI